MVARSQSRGARRAALAAGLTAPLVVALVATGAPAHASPAPASAPSPAAPSAATSPESELQAMSLAQRVGQLVMVGTPATGVSAAARDAITRHHVGSVVLTGRSTAGVAATRRVTDQLQSLVSTRSTRGEPLYVATDQEGGYVQVLQGPGFSRIPTALAQGTWSTYTVKARAQQWGEQLRRAGVNLNLAPVMDTVSKAFAPHNRPIGYYEREFGYTPYQVLMKGTAFANGMRAAHLQVAIKHFPGLGRVRGNTDVSSGVTDRVTTRHSASIQPFAAGIRAGAQFVMVSTADYAKIDPGRPAAFSTRIITGMLRGDLGFDGVVISDDLGSAAQVRQWAPGTRAVNFVRAGGDMVLTVAPATVAPMTQALIERAQAVPAFATKVNEAALRVLQAKHRAGLDPGTAPTFPPLVVDGILGPATTRAVQRWLHVGVDGVWGPITTRAFQRRVGAYPDGVIGPRTVAAAQRFLQIRRDGASWLDHRTVRALQRYLNDHR